MNGGITMHPKYDIAEEVFQSIQGLIIARDNIDIQLEYARTFNNPSSLVYLNKAKNGILHSLNNLTDVYKQICRKGVTT